MDAARAGFAGAARECVQEFHVDSGQSQLMGQYQAGGATTCDYYLCRDHTNLLNVVKFFNVVKETRTLLSCQGVDEEVR